MKNTFFSQACIRCLQEKPNLKIIDQKLAVKGVWRHLKCDILVFLFEMATFEKSDNLNNYLSFQKASS